MTVKRFQKEHNGVTYIGVRDDDRTVTGSITNGDKKWTLKGFPKINRTEGSYKHGREIQITLWNKAGTTIEQDRVEYAKGRWDTLEIFFPPEVLHDLFYEYFSHIPPPKGGE